jgi:DNA-binding SARP family transcriptional activator
MKVAVGGVPLAGKVYGKLLALLAFLAVENSRSHPRERLAELFWPALTPEAARGNLRQSLYNLRRLLGDGTADFFVTGRESVHFCGGDTVWLDLRAFAATPVCPGQPAPGQCTDCLAQMEHCAVLWRGEFLAGLSLEDAPAFEEWRAAQRESLHRQMLALLERLRLCHEQQGAFDRALQHAQRYVELEPWDESGQRDVMRLLAVNGQRSAALAQYEVCRSMLTRELGMAPEAATQHLYERIRDGLVDSARPGPRVLALPAAPERRQVTVVHCSLTVPGENDAEEIAERLRQPYGRCAEIMGRYGAHLAAADDSTLVAYFGYPAAFEDAARRAVRTALALPEAGSESGVALRIGVHTGVIVTGGNPDRPDSAGVASKVALRLGDRAAPGEVVISDATRRLVDGYFHLHPLGPQPLAESSQPIRVFRVSGETGASCRLDAASSLLPLVGRRTELETLQVLWAETWQGRGQRVLLRGEAGLGKSRLLRALRETLAGESWSIRELYCQPEHRHTPLQPLLAYFERLLVYGPDDGPAAKRDMLAVYLTSHHAKLRDQATPLLEALLGIAEQPLSLSPEQQKQATIEVLLKLLGDAAGQQPLLLAVEDVHWADPATLELLGIAAQQDGDRPLLAVYTSRSEEPLPPWLLEDTVQIELTPLDDAAITALVLEAEADLEEATVSRIVARADGVPLFAEELAHLAAEPEGVGDIPPTLGYLLAARLDAADAARRIAQIAATVGREFDVDLLERAAALDTTANATTLAQSLQALQEARLIVAMGDTRFQFRHALIREAAYQSQTRVDRQAAHRCLADALIGDFPLRAEREPAQVARHLSEAGAPGEAIPWRLAVGHRALRAAAYAEAAEHLRCGLAAIGTLPQEQRNGMELELLLPLGHALLALAGFGSAEAAAVFDRARTLCGGSESDAQRFEILWGQWMVSSSRSDSGFDASAPLVDEMLSLAHKSGNRTWLAHAEAGAANLALWQGRFEAACSHGLAAGAAAREARGGQFIDTHDPEVAGLSYLSWACCSLGRQAEAVAAGEQAVAVARRLNHPDSLCFALIYKAVLHRMRREAPAVVALTEEAMVVAVQHRLRLWQGAGMMLLGWAQAFSGDAEGIQMVAASVAVVRNIMPGVLVDFLHPLAEAYGFVGDYGTQLATLEEAIAASIHVGEYFHRADLYRLQAECLQRLGSSEAAAVFLAAPD